MPVYFPSVPSGVIADFAGIAVPNGWLFCDGSALLIADYSKLYNALVAVKGIVTATIASPSVFTLNAHGLLNGDAVFLTTTGTLPTGFSTFTTYYVVSTATNTFELALTVGGAAINGTGTQTGTHTVSYAPFGVSNSTTFNLPDAQGRESVGKGTNTDVQNLGGSDGLVIASRTPKHTHGPGTLGGTTGAPSATVAATALGGGAASPTHTHPFTATTGVSAINEGSYLVVNKIIKI